jgi:hypothetical protein
MVEPVIAQDIMIATMSGALIVLFGAIYALLYAWSKLQKNSTLMVASYLAYILFVAATMSLAKALNLDGFWSLVTAVMIVGYFIAPRGIWYLCVGTHKTQESHHEAS